MYIVGFTGPINHGKTTAAKFLMAEEPSSKHIESREVISEVAMQLNKHFDPAMVDPRDLTSINSWLFHLLDILPGVINVRPTFDQLEIRDHELDKSPEVFEKLYVYIDRLHDNPSMAKEPIDDETAEVHRPILQWLGGYLPTVLGETIWFDEVMRRVSAADESVKLYTIAGLRYPSDSASVRHHGGKIIEIIRPEYELGDQNDPTEARRSEIAADVVILNDGGLDDLKDIMKAVWQDLSTNRLRFEYRSSN